MLSNPDATAVQVSATVHMQVAIARRQHSEDRPAKRVFVKCHNHINGRQFDSASAKSEVELLHRLGKDPLLCKHLPRLDRTVWLDSRTSRRSQPMTESHSENSQPPGGSIPANSSHVLMLEFDRRAGKVLTAVSKEARSNTACQHTSHNVGLLSMFCLWVC